MKKMRFLVMVAAVLAAGAFVPGQEQAERLGYFTASVEEQAQAGRESLAFLVDTPDFWPYGGQTGWRICFSQAEMAGADPAYDFAVWYLPPAGEDLSRRFCVARPAGLAGTWHYRVEAMDAARQALASSLELTHDFTTPPAAYSDTIPYATTEGDWVMALSLANPTDEAATANVAVWTADGRPVPVDADGNVVRVEIPPRGSWANYLRALLGDVKFSGPLTVTSTAPVRWMTIIGTASAPVGGLLSGEAR